MSGNAERNNGLERRSAERLDIEAAVTCMVRTRSLDAIAYDLSIDGCMIETSSASLKAGDPIVLCFPGQTPFAGRVVWTKHRNAGVQFSEKLDRPAVSCIANAHGRARRARGGLVEHARCRASLVFNDPASVTQNGSSGAKFVCWEHGRLASTAEYAFWAAMIAYSTLLLMF